jgi:hypothetical protein
MVAHTHLNVTLLCGDIVTDNFTILPSPYFIQLSFVISYRFPVVLEGVRLSGLRLHDK